MSDLSAPGNAQADAIAEIIQRVNPDVLLINEFDYDAGGVALQGFIDNYLAVPHGDAAPITDYDYTFIAPSNTGIHSGLRSRLQQRRIVDPVAGPFNFDYANDCVRFRVVPRPVWDGRALQLSDRRSGDTDVPELPVEGHAGCVAARRSDTPEPADWYSQAELGIFRLSSKSHWDVPIEINNGTVHFLVSHPTPPVFDGPEDRNGTRNFDEIRFWADYVHPGRSGYIYDDNGDYGGLAGSDLFVIAGDQNSDPLDGDSIPGAIQQLLDHPKVNTKVTPSSLGGPEQALLTGGLNDVHLSDPAFDTADFSDVGPGNLRADYVLPRKNMKITDAGVFWPLSTDPTVPAGRDVPVPEFGSPAGVDRRQGELNELTGLAQGPSHRDVCDTWVMAGKGDDETVGWRTGLTGRPGELR